MQNRRVLSLKVRLVILGLASRFLVFVTVITLLATHMLTYSRFWQLFYIVAPLSGLYFVLFGRFLVNNFSQYVSKGQLLSRSYVSVCYYGFLLLNIIEFVLIVLEIRYLVSGVADFFMCIAVIETTSALLAGFYIVDLFSKAPAGIGDK